MARINVQSVDQLASANVTYDEYRKAREAQESALLRWIEGRGGSRETWEKTIVKQNNMWKQWLQQVGFEE